MTKILQLAKTYPGTGGVERVALDILDGIPGSGMQCDMLCANDDNVKPATTYQLGSDVRIICLRKAATKFSTPIVPSMLRVLRRICNSYDIIHIHHPNPMTTFALWMSGYKGKVIVHWHSDIRKQRHLLRLYMPLQNWLLRRADAIIGTSPVYIDGSPHLAKFRSKCVSVPIGISPVQPDEKTVAIIRQRYKGKKIVFALGRLVYYKGFRYLIDAAAELPDNYIVLIGGDGELRKELQQQIDSKRLDGKVKLLGFVSDADVAAYYGACDIYCLSSVMKTEAFAIVQLEAMSCGKPIVATNIPDSGVSWVNAHGVSGLNVNVKDSHALAVAMTKIIEDPALYNTLSVGARNRFNTLFRKEKMNNKVIALYKHLSEE